ncbi:MAG: UPF0104 family protein [Desulfobacteraceae bacterium]|nr:MAG: UPF0104 family protein [Desulfobacteraceae bacterium]
MKARLRIWAGIAVGLLFMYLALRKISLQDLLVGFGNASYWPLFPCAALVLLAHLLRAFRWQVIMNALKMIRLGVLFSALMIGYVVNSVTPAHLGELVRAYLVGKEERIPVSAVLATVVIERIIDIFSLLVLMFLAVFLYPFPDWVTQSGYMMLAGTLGLIFFLAIIRFHPVPSLRYLTWACKFLPGGFGQKITEAGESFISGLVPLRRWYDYVTVSILSAAIWFCYGMVFHLSLYAFNFTETYDANWLASLLLLVITTIAVVIPSSPGYVGTYHYLCQLTLAMFMIPPGQALSFAAVVHLVNFIPVTVVGLLCAKRQGMAIIGEKKH